MSKVKIREIKAWYRGLGRRAKEWRSRYLSHETSCLFVALLCAGLFFFVAFNPPTRWLTANLVLTAIMALFFLGFVSEFLKAKGWMR